MPSFVEMFVCEVSWAWYGGARVVEVFGVRVGACGFCFFFSYVGGRRFSSFCESDCGGCIW